MLRNVLRSKALVALVVPVFMAGVAFASGAPCHGEQAAAGAGSHCNLFKNIVKTAEMTDDGAVVTLKGKTPEAISHVKSHLESHSKGEHCPNCPLSQEGITTKIEITEDGGVITATGSSDETIKAVQEWAKVKDCCCGKGAKQSA